MQETILEDGPHDHLDRGQCRRTNAQADSSVSAIPIIKRLAAT